MKSIIIYKTKNNFKIETLYKREHSSYMVSKPIFVLPLDISVEDLSSKLFESLNASRVIKEFEEDALLLGKKLLALLKEKSFENLYFNCTSCSVRLKDSNVEIMPYKYAAYKQGMTEVNEDVIIIPYNSIDKITITNIVLEVLEKNY